VIGEVTAVTPQPAGFTVHSQDGEDITAQVLESTVFMAGPDRPYRFDLLKVGDEVRARLTRPGLGLGVRRAGEVAPQPDLPVARVVRVRPAGERALGNGAGPRRGGAANGA
jgi:hypothetical protein